MYAKLASELAFYTYRRSEAERLNLDGDTVGFWTAKFYGFARCVEVVTGDYPIAFRRNGYEVEVRIGDYQTIITFD